MAPTATIVTAGAGTAECGMDGKGRYEPGPQRRLAWDFTLMNGEL